MILLLLLTGTTVTIVSGHGRLIEPPSRSTMWRYGFSNPPNFNDHEIYCGGFTRQWRTNGGKCGVCGDPWDQPQPRDNEGGGKYGRGTITRLYTENSQFKVKIELTANHMGYFEFRLCPQNNPLVPASQACLNRHLLQQVDGSGSRFYPGEGNKVFDVELELPPGLTCTQCVLQWRYVAANNWGVCEDGTGKVGCGPQEEFRACSDISITDINGFADNKPSTDVDTFEDLDDIDEVEEIDDNSVVWNDDNTFYPVQKVPQYPEFSESDAGERTAVIVLASILTAVLLFAGIFLYYYKLKYIISDLNIPSLPSIPKKFKVKLPHVQLPSVKLPHVKSLGVSSGFDKLRKMTGSQWPLSGQKVRPEISAPIPIPPPRVKRGRSRAQSRATSPDPVTRNGAGVLDISGPTEVTINGVTVGHSGHSVMGRTAGHGPTPSSRGVICDTPSRTLTHAPTPSTRGIISETPTRISGLGPIPSSRGNTPNRTLSTRSVMSDTGSCTPVTPSSAGVLCDNVAPVRTVWSAHPALVIADQPDSSLSLDIPPPLPDCPPPEDSLVISLQHHTSDNTDA